TRHICPTRRLCLLLATIYLSLRGRVGLRRLARINYAKAEYAKQRVRETRGLHLPVAGATFNEFAVAVPDSGAAALARAEAAGMVGGLDLAPYEPELGSAVLVGTTGPARRAATQRR